MIYKVPKTYVKYRVKKVTILKLSYSDLLLCNASFKKAQGITLETRKNSKGTYYGVILSTKDLRKRRSLEVKAIKKGTSKEILAINEAFQNSYYHSLKLNSFINKVSNEQRNQVDKLFKGYLKANKMPLKPAESRCYKLEILPTSTLFITLQEGILILTIHPKIGESIKVHLDNSFLEKLDLVCSK